MDEKIGETIAQGVKDELEAALNYTAIAGRCNSVKLKRAFLNYAMEEMAHAQKLLSLTEHLALEVEPVALALTEPEDLMITLIENIAKEESAIFYYEVLTRLHSDEAIQVLCRGIQQEEKRHLSNISEILAKIKSGEYTYE